MKLKTLLFSLACFFPALAQASEVEFIYSGRIDSLYGYNVPAGRYKHNDHRDHWINLFSLNLGLEKEFNADYRAGLYADLNAGIRRFTALSTVLTGGLCWARLIIPPISFRSGLREPAPSD